MRPRLLIAASVTAVLLAACGGGGDSKADTVRSTTSTTEDHDGESFEKVGEAIGDAGDDAGDEPEVDAEAPDGCEVGSGDADALESLMPAGPAGFEQQPDDVGDTGPSDFDKAVADDSLDDAAEVLTEAGFLAGYQRYWISDAQEADLIAFLYEFCDESGAQLYVDRNNEEQEQWAGVHDFTPSGLSAVHAESGTEDGYTAAQVAVVHGPFLVMTVSGTNGPVDEAPFEALATDLAKAMIAELDEA